MTELAGSFQNLSYVHPSLAQMFRRWRCRWIHFYCFTICRDFSCNNQLTWCDLYLFRCYWDDFIHQKYLSKSRNISSMNWSTLTIKKFILKEYSSVRSHALPNYISNEMQGIFLKNRNWAKKIIKILVHKNLCEKKINKSNAMKWTMNGKVIC